MNEVEFIKLLKENTEFSRVTENALGELIRAGEIRDFEEGAVIIRERETSQHIWILIEGGMEVLLGDEIINRVVHPGEFVGQISAVSLTPATATVRLSTPGKCLSVPHRALHEVMERFPDLAEAVLRSMAKYLGRR